MAADGQQVNEAERKTKILISYSRKDMAFADRSHRDLCLRGPVEMPS